MWYIARNAVVNLGGNTISHTPILVAYERRPILTVVRSDQTGYLGVDCKLLDANGEGVATVKHNQIYRHEGKRDLYKIDGNADRFVLLNRETEEVLIDIQINRAEREEINISTNLYLPNGLLFQATPHEITLPRENHFINNAIDGFRIAFNVLENGSFEVGVM